MLTFINLDRNNDEVVAVVRHSFIIGIIKLRPDKRYQYRGFVFQNLTLVFQNLTDAIDTINTLEEINLNDRKYTSGLTNSGDAIQTETICGSH